VPRRFVAEPEVGGQVDDARVRQPRRQGGRLAVRQGHEDQLGVAERFGRGLREVLAIER
jgi:hypothetical protein